MLRMFKGERQSITLRAMAAAPREAAKTSFEIARDAWGDVRLFPVLGYAVNVYVHEPYDHEPRRLKQILNQVFLGYSPEYRRMTQWAGPPAGRRRRANAWMSARMQEAVCRLTRVDEKGNLEYI